MRDESLQELERELRTAPDDAGLRIRLAAALGRSGRRGEALARLDLGSVPDAHADEATKLAAELWRDELLALEKAQSVPGAHVVDDIAIDPTGTVVAWRSAASGLKVVRIATGEVLFEDEDHDATNFVLVRGRLFSRAPARGDQAELLSLDWSGTTPRVERARVSGWLHLFDAAPDGALLHLQDQRGEGVFRWPTLERVVEVPCRAVRGVVDWDARLLVVPQFTTLDVHAFDERRTISLPGGSRVHQRVTALGRGVIAKGHPGIVLHRLPDRWTLTVVDPKVNVPLPPPSLSADGRGLRLVLGSEPLRIELDSERGQLRSHSRELLERRARARAREDQDVNVLWHPHADVVLHRRRQGFYELRALDGTVLRKLPAGSWPKGWTGDGRALLTLRTAGEGKAWIELWRARG